MGVLLQALELKHIVVTNLIRVSYLCISYCSHFNIPFKRLYTLATRQSASVKFIKVGVEDVSVCVHIEGFKRRADLGYR